MFMLRHAPGTVARLSEFVADVSTPGRLTYGQYLVVIPRLWGQGRRMYPDPIFENEGRERGSVFYGTE